MEQAREKHSQKHREALRSIEKGVAPAVRSDERNDRRWKAELKRSQKADSRNLEGPGSHRADVVPQLARSTMPLRNDPCPVDGRARQRRSRTAPASEHRSRSTINVLTHILNCSYARRVSEPRCRMDHRCILYLRQDVGDLELIRLTAIDQPSCISCLASL
jgi:hypothetical protein